LTAPDTRAQLPAALSELGLVLSPQACGQLLGHLDLIAKWNRVYNLTAVRDPAEMWTHHLLDSLAAVRPLAAYWAARRAAGLLQDASAQPQPWARVEAQAQAQAQLPPYTQHTQGPPHEGLHILDVGSGAGLPGVTLAIALPQALAAASGRSDAAPYGAQGAVPGEVPAGDVLGDAPGDAPVDAPGGAPGPIPGPVPQAASRLGPAAPPPGAGIRVTCVDTVAKKAGFIRQVGVELGLGWLEAVHGRIESLKPLQADVITCRAFASLSDIVSLTRVHLAPGGVWMALKGVVPTDEIKALPPDIDVFHVEPLHVPHLNAQRCLVWMRPRPQR
jgi:16S rRNA G527 N7-methylase RsmG